MAARKTSQKSPQKPAPKAPAKAPPKRREPVLSAADFLARREMLPLLPSSGWTPDDVMAALESHDRGNFRQSENLYHALTRDPRIGPGLESRANAIRTFPFSLSVKKDAPERLRTAAEQLQESWGECLGETDRSEIIKRVIMFGFTVARISWTLHEGQQIFRLRPWTHSSLWYDYSARVIRGIDESGVQVEIRDGDPEWVIFSRGGEQPWLSGDIRRLGRLYFLESFLLDRWAALCDTQAGAVKGLHTPALKREQEEVKKLWAVVDQLRVGDTVLLPEGFSLELIEAAANGHAAIRDLLDWVDRSISIVLKGHSAAQETTGKVGTYGATMAAVDVSRDLSISDVSYLAGPLSRGPLRLWVKANFSPALYQELPRPLLSYSPVATWDTREPEDQEKISKVGQAFSSALKNLSDAAGGLAPLVAAGLDLAAAIKKCGFSLKDSGTEAAAAEPTS